MANPTLSRLAGFAAAAKKQRNPHLYLQRLGPLHNQWHSVPATRRSVGFLLFHWHVVAYFNDLGLGKTMGVKPYKLADFQPGGQFDQADWATLSGNPAAAKSVANLEANSIAIERWHNEAHMVIGDATGAPMMDPSVNIFYSAFWDLHGFINARFEADLKS